VLYGVELDEPMQHDDGTRLAAVKPPTRAKTQAAQAREPFENVLKKAARLLSFRHSPTV
jgi:hypothetical protein